MSMCQKKNNTSDITNRRLSGIIQCFASATKQSDYNLDCRCFLNHLDLNDSHRDERATEKEVMKDYPNTFIQMSHILAHLYRVQADMTCRLLVAACNFCDNIYI